MVNLKDVAKRAGVSSATVSRVINSPEKVNPSTREIVERAMKELSYVPNISASSIMTKRNKSIGIIVPDIANAFFSNIVRGIQDRCSECGYSVLVANSDDIHKKEYDAVYLLYSHRVDGMILAASGIRDPEYCGDEWKILNNVPTVLVDREVDGADFPIIKTDDFKASYTATQYLISNGHRNILYLTGFTSMMDRYRRSGYLEALADHGIMHTSEIAGQFRLDVAYREVKKYLSSLHSKGQYPTAIFAGNDLMAIGAMKACSELKIRVPEDISIMGYDNIPFSECTMPALTTMNQPAYELGVSSANCLMSIMTQSGTVEKRTLIEASLVCRDSVCKVAKDKDLIIKNT